MLRIRRKESGSAIVAVLLIVAVITIVAVGLMAQQRIDIRRTQQLQTASQAYRYSQAVLYWAVGQIKTAEKPAQTPEYWQVSFPTMTIPNHRGQVNGQLERVDQRTNINDLDDATKQDQFVKSMATLVPDLSELELRSIIQNINGWVKPAETDLTNPSATNQGTNLANPGASNQGSPTTQTVAAPNNDSYYASLVPPYRTPRMLMVSPSELRLVMGVDANVYEKLRPYIIAVPAEGSLGDYYLLQTEVVLDDQKLRVYSLLKKEGDSPSAIVSVLWSTQGTW